MSIKELFITIFGTTLSVWLISVCAGLLGSLTGLGGGIIIVPFLTIVLHVDMHYAIGAGLISVISTSSGAAIASSKESFANVRIGMFLEIAASIGALIGTFLITIVAPKWVAVIFGLVLIHSAYMSFRKKEGQLIDIKPDKIASFLKMNGQYTGENGVVNYNVCSVPGGFFVMVLAGVLSALLGIGSGAMKVIGMDTLMKIPFKVSTSTSNFMIGITAAISVGIYLKRGYVDPGLAMPVMLGVLIGSITGTRFLRKAKTKVLRQIFAITIALLGIEMMYKGIIGKF